MRLVAAVALTILGCASSNSNKVTVSGRVHSVAPEDLKAAMVADKLAHINPNVPYEPYYVQVIDRNEIHGYQRTHSDYKQFTVVRRVGDHWEVTKIGIESDHPI
jgi:hypothetical protein